MFQNVLLAFDGSEPARRAAQMVAGLVRFCPSPVVLRVVVAYDPIPSYLGEPQLQSVIDERIAEAETVLRQALDVLGETPADIHTEILEGPAADAILRVAQTRGNDLIVMGSRGLGQITGLLLGSQSQKVLNHAPCPVLVVR
ncbi:MAG: universal stress protein [Anaerolineae bacterium]|nr:MAG: universal stress protein [Anaerolineae bacterium]